MSAGSFPELFLQYFAWGIYNILWDVMVNLGVVYLPFGYYLFDAYTSAREKGNNKMTSARVLAYLEMKIFLGVVVLTLAGVPTIVLNLTDMRFNNRSCTVGSKVATMLEVKPDSTGTGTDLDAEFTTSNMGSLISKAPVAWMAVLSIGQAVSDAVRIKIPCKTSISQVAYELQMNKIDDPAVKQEIGNRRIF
ncbi:MAG: conjugal transfer protein TraG N-terminal domain-containing protein [gamma proteobacterium symbiont of Lucinoma myriamae]|nr:conjugal transfer protein TraG N-terminal domain-containing protein [gamma proteobacterium symbiont of Lucinoma myriamae]MCU7817952.1 conjugal transfer protein TraG N-terminal domain-containing protein [gamma proteobacterium symbiont of Lucinoma myriamae]